jgi:hypothetical protein
LYIQKMRHEFIVISTIIVILLIFMYGNEKNESIETFVHCWYVFDLFVKSMTNCTGLCLGPLIACNAALKIGFPS